MSLDEAVLDKMARLIAFIANLDEGTLEMVRAQQELTDLGEQNKDALMLMNRVVQLMVSVASGQTKDLSGLTVLEEKAVALLQKHGLAPAKT